MCKKQALHSLTHLTHARNCATAAGKQIAKAPHCTTIYLESKFNYCNFIYMSFIQRLPRAYDTAFPSYLSVKSAWSIQASIRLPAMLPPTSSIGTVTGSDHREWIIVVVLRRKKTNGQTCSIREAQLPHRTD